jgi:hypothetical protein
MREWSPTDGCGSLAPARFFDPAANGHVMNQTHLFYVGDPEGLHAALKRVLERCPKQRKAAKLLDISQATFSRLLSRTDPKRAEQSASESLWPEPMRFPIRRSVYRTIDRRIRTIFGPVEGAALQKRLRSSLITEASRPRLLRWREWERGEFKRLKAKVGGLMVALWSMPQYRRVFEDFLARMNEGNRELPKWHWGTIRLWIAMHRALEPLAAAVATGGVERSWHELHRAHQLRKFLEDALRNERKLMRRRSDEYLSRITDMTLEDDDAPLPEPGEIERRPAEEEFEADM